MTFRSRGYESAHSRFSHRLRGRRLVHPRDYLVSGLLLAAAALTSGCATSSVLDSGEDGHTGRVHFRATCRDDGGFAVLEERSRFVREHNHWLYLDGEHTVTALKPGRNDPCPCGSGRKFKKCCAA